MAYKTENQVIDETVKNRMSTEEFLPWINTAVLRLYDRVMDESSTIGDRMVAAETLETLTNHVAEAYKFASARNLTS
jgi:hypothetical protein